MANYFNLTLDTTGPASPSISLEGGATYATAALITATIGTADGVTTGYQMKIWGSVNVATNANIQTLEGGSAWITYSTSQQVELSSGDGTKTIYLKIRDSVYNESSQASDTITLDTSLPIATITGPDVSTISKQTGKNVSSFSFQVNSDFVEYKVMVVGSSGAAHNAGGNVQLLTTSGSTNMTGTGTWTNASVINSTINGTDLETASAGDTAKIIKVFVKDAANLWSV